jgi:hypothetical protein
MTTYNEAKGMDGNVTQDEIIDKIEKETKERCRNANMNRIRLNGKQKRPDHVEIIPSSSSPKISSKISFPSLGRGGR